MIVFPYFEPRLRVDPYGPLWDCRPAGRDVKAADSDGRGLAAYGLWR